MKKQKMKRFVCLVLVSACCWGCSGGDLKTGGDRQDEKPKTVVASGHSAVMTLIEPNQLISRAEAEAFTGEPLLELQYEEKPAIGMKKCYYGAARAGSSRFFQISIQQTAFMPEKMREASQTPKKIFENTRKILSEDRVDIHNLGDEAFIGTIALHILKGDYYITIRLGNPDGAQNRKELEAAGKKALENLQRLMI